METTTSVTAAPPPVTTDPAAAGPPERRTPRRPARRIASGRGRVLRRGATGVLGTLLVWEVVARFDLLPRDALPPASSTIARAAELVVDTTFLGNVGATLWASLVGYLLALVVALPLGMLLGLSDRLYLVSSTVIELLRPLPPVGLVPLLVLVAGQGLEMKAAVVALGCVWPLLINTIHGVHATDSTARATARSFGWSRRQVAIRVVWPSAIPSVLTGVRITVSVALILCVGAEFIGGSTAGLGSWLLQQSMLPGGIESVCAGVVIAGSLGLLINGAVSALETRFAAWARREEA